MSHPTPHEHFLEIYRSTNGDLFAAIRGIRERFGVTLVQAKEIYIQATGVAPTLDAYQQEIAVALEEAFKEAGLGSKDAGDA